MSIVDIWLLVVAAILAVVAGLFSSADAALSSFSKVRAEEIAAEGKAGSNRLLKIVEDSPRYLNTALLLRLLFETSAAVLLTLVVLGWFDDAKWPTILTSVAVMLDLIVPDGGSESGPQSITSRWLAMLATLGIMLVVSFVVIGVAPRTVGRQHSERIALCRRARCWRSPRCSAHCRSC